MVGKHACCRGRADLWQEGNGNCVRSLALPVAIACPVLGSCAWKVQGVMEKGATGDELAWLLSCSAALAALGLAESAARAGRQVAKTMDFYPCRECRLAEQAGRPVARTMDFYPCRVCRAAHSVFVRPILQQQRRGRSVLFRGDVRCGRLGSMKDVGG